MSNPITIRPGEARYMLACHGGCAAVFTFDFQTVMNLFARHEHPCSLWGPGTYQIPTDGMLCVSVNTEQRSGDERDS